MRAVAKARAAAAFRSAMSTVPPSRRIARTMSNASGD